MPFFGIIRDFGFAPDFLTHHDIKRPWDFFGILWEKSSKKTERIPQKKTEILPLSQSTSVVTMTVIFSGKTAFSSILINIHYRYWWMARIEVFQLIRGDSFG